MSLDFLRETSEETLSRIDGEREIAERTQQRAARRAKGRQQREAVNSRIVTGVAAGVLAVSAMVAGHFSGEHAAEAETKADQQTAALASVPQSQKAQYLGQLCLDNPTVTIAGVNVCDVAAQVNP